MPLNAFAERIKTAATVGGGTEHAEGKIHFVEDVSGKRRAMEVAHPGRRRDARFYESDLI